MRKTPWHTDPDFRGLLLALATEEGDPAGDLAVLADWLEERGDGRGAEIRRFHPPAERPDLSMIPPGLFQGLPEAGRLAEARLAGGPAWRDLPAEVPGPPPAPILFVCDCGNARDASWVGGEPPRACDLDLRFVTARPLRFEREGPPGRNVLGFDVPSLLLGVEVLWLGFCDCGRGVWSWSGWPAYRAKEPKQRRLRALSLFPEGPSWRVDGKPLFGFPVRYGDAHVSLGSAAAVAETVEGAVVGPCWPHRPLEGPAGGG